MGFPTGDIKLSANFELSISKPLDSRNTVTNYSDLNTISFKYAGMIVYVSSTDTFYGLKGDLTTWYTFNMSTSGSVENTISATNGLSLVNNNIELGGTVYKYTEIDANGNIIRFANTSDFSIGDSFSILSETTMLSSPYSSNHQIILDGYNGYTQFKSSNLSSNYVILNTDYLTNDSYIQFPNKSGVLALLEDTTSGTVEISATNGLISIGNNIELGGQLYKDTLISGNFNLSFGNDTDSLDSFDVSSKILLKNITKGFNIGGSGFNGDIKAIQIQTDGKILVGGGFSQYNGIGYSTYLVRLNSDGSIDTSFNSGGSGFNYVVSSIQIQTDGKILVGGYFTTYNGVDCPDKTVRLNSDGTLDTSFNSGGSGFNNVVSSIQIQTDGKILVGGNFTQYNGVDCPDYLVRLNSDGTLDTSFNSGGSGFNNVVNTIQIQTDGKILVGGGFTQYNGVDCPDYLVRLNSDGTLDTSFNSGGSGFDSNVNTIQIQTDDKILVGGYFISYNGVDCPDCLVRLNSDGSIDTSFNSGGSGFSSFVSSVKIQTDGKILVGGGFTQYNGVDCPDKLFRIYSDGSTLDDFDVDTKVLLNSVNGLLYDDNYHNRYLNRTLVDKEYVDNKIPIKTSIKQTSLNVNSTTGWVGIEFDTTGINLTEEPMFYINGILYEFGYDSTPTNNQLMFSVDGGTTAITDLSLYNDWGVIRIYWNPSFAGSFNLDTSDKLRLDYYTVSV